MKKLHYLLMLAVASVLMASCGYPDHLKTLPKETVAVVSLDLAGMASKGDLHKLQEADFYKKMQEEMAKKDAESAKETDEFLKNPLNYGINFLEPVYLFAINNNQAMPFGGVSVALGDAPKFETFITKITKSGEVVYTIEKGTGYSFLSTDDITFAWNEFALVITNKADTANSNVATLESIFTEKDKDQSVVSQPGFSDYYDDSKDISVWVSSTALDIVKNVMEGVDAESGSSENEEFAKIREQLEGSSFQMHMAFNDDEILTEYSFEMSDKLQEAYDKEIFKKGSPEKLSNLVREKDFAVFATSINIQNYLSMMQNNPAVSGETKETINSYITVVQQFVAPFDGDLLFTVSNLTIVEREVTESVRIETEEPLDSLVASGDTLLIADTVLTADASGQINDDLIEELSWDELEAQYRDTTYIKKTVTPIFLAATTVNDESLGLILGMALGKDKPKAGKVTKSDLGSGIVIYSTIKDKVIVVSNDKKTIEDINSGTFTNGGKSLQADGSSDHGMYMYANLNLEEYPADVKEEMTKPKSTKDAKQTEALLQFFQMFDHMEAYNNDNYSAILSFKLKPTGNNSLYTLIEGMGNAAYSSGALK